MVLPPKPVDIAFEEFLQALPPDYHALAFEFKAQPFEHGVYFRAAMSRAVET
jgi:hypothetical protein